MRFIPPWLTMRRSTLIIRQDLLTFRRCDFEQRYIYRTRRTSSRGGYVRLHWMFVLLSTLLVGLRSTTTSCYLLTGGTGSSSAVPVLLLPNGCDIWWLVNCQYLLIQSATFHCTIVALLCCVYTLYVVEMILLQIFFLLIFEIQLCSIRKPILFIKFMSISDVLFDQS